MDTSPGALLRDLREARGVSLEEIARATRVSRRHLEALEGDDWAELPGSVFIKGFIRGYCQHLGVAPEEVLAQYRQTVGEVGPAAGPPPPVARHVGRRRGIRTGVRPSARGPTRAPVRAPVVVSGVLLVLLAAGLAVLTLGRQSEKAPPPAPAVSESTPTVAPVAQAPEAAVARAPEPQSGEPSSAAPAPAEPPVAPSAAPLPAAPGPPVTGAPRPDAGHNLVVKAVEPTWVRIQVDDGRAVQELLPAGATRQWVAERRFLLTVGNAGGLELELNGKRLPPLGERGSVIRELVLPGPEAGSGS